MKKWKTLERQEKGRSIIFKHEVVKRESPDSGAIGSFDVVHCLNWVNVIAVTKNEEIILVKQYRHGTDELTLEIPGGAVDRGEDFDTAARRELLEETGFECDELIKIGVIDPNPAFMSNKCATYLALGCKKVSDLKLDQFEEIELEFYKKEDIPQMIKSGTITHSLVISAFHLWGLQ